MVPDVTIEQSELIDKASKVGLGIDAEYLLFELQISVADARKELGL